MTGNFLIYGANGYTGELITRCAVERGMKPIVAGRNAITVEEMAKKHHLGQSLIRSDLPYPIQLTINNTARTATIDAPIMIGIPTRRSA
jgi:short subunit dehydrogenase-like uncharacterized protein